MIGHTSRHGHRKSSGVLTTTLLAVVALGGCSSDAEPVPTSTVPAMDEVRFWVEPETIDCLSRLAPQCLQIATSATAEPQTFLGEIEGFEHQAGTTYVIDVEVTEVVDAAPDDLPARYRLVAIVESSTGTRDEPIPSLQSTSWTLTEPAEADVFPGEEITLDFSDNEVSGFAGCNRYEAGFESDRTSLTIETIRTTLTECYDFLNTREGTYLDTLQDIDDAEITSDGTLLLRSDTAQLEFDPAQPPN